MVLASGTNRDHRKEGQIVYVAYSPGTVYKDVGTTRQLFIDDDVVAVVKTVTRRQHTPKKHSGNPLIRRDKPWEGNTYFRNSTFNVIRDPADGLFKCWYEDYYDYFGTDKSKIFQGNRVYYAQSEDGVNWKKPLLGKHRVGGHDTNTVASYPPYSMVSCTSVLLDEREPDPARRFKMVFFRRVQDINLPKKVPGSRHSGGLCMMFSP